jgi:hypothetical protein
MAEDHRSAGEGTAAWRIRVRRLAREFGGFVAAIALSLCRLTLVLGGLMFSAGVGVLIPYLFRADIANLQPAGLVFGAATVLAVAKQLVEAGPLVWEFVAGASPSALLRFCVQVCVAGLGLGFAYYTISPNPPPPTSPALSLHIAGSLPPLVFHEGDALITAYVMFEESQMDLDPQDPQRDLVRNLVASLLACLQAPSDGVRLTVRGFASSSGDDASNEKLSTQRASTVIGWIEHDVREANGGSHDSRFTVEAREWSSLDVMKSRRLFRDVDRVGGYSLDAGRLNRRAEIRVQAAGACFSR